MRKAARLRFSREEQSGFISTINTVDRGAIEIRTADSKCFGAFRVDWPDLPNLRLIQAS